MEERIEFIEQQEESGRTGKQSEPGKKVIKGLFDGTILTREGVVRQLPYILFIVLLAIIYIGNRYHAEKVVRQESRLNMEIRELRAKSVSTAAELMDISRQSEVARLIKEKGMLLEEAVKPPKKLVIKE